MSLTLAMYNAYGIVLSADRRITLTINRTDTLRESVPGTDFEQKIFLLKNGYGLSYSGTSSSFIAGPDGLTRKIPLSVILQNYLGQIKPDKFSPETLFKMVLEHIKSFCSEEDNTIFFLGGFHQGLPFVFTANTKDAEINFLLSENHTSGLSYAGASDTLSPLLNTPGFVYDYQSYNIPDMVHFSSFLIQTVSKLQHYQLRINNVSEESDILVITSDKSYWASMPVSLSLQSGTL